MFTPAKLVPAGYCTVKLCGPKLNWLGAVGLSVCVIDCEVGGRVPILTLYAAPLTGMLAVTVLFVVETTDINPDDKLVCHTNAPSGVTAEPRGLIPTGTVSIIEFVARF